MIPTAHSTPQPSPLDPDVWFFPLENERRRVELRHDGEVVAKMDGIAPLTLHVGCARVRIDGIDGLETRPEHRGKGYAARLVKAVVAEMSAGDAALALLYGITDFYPRFGFATAGPEHYLLLTQGATRYPMPPNWSVRRATLDDLPTVRALYEASVADAVGAEVRPLEGRVWTKMRADLEGSDDAPGECRLIIAPDGTAEGYVWLNPTFWYVAHLKHNNVPPGTTVFAEVISESGSAAKATLAACRAWDEELRGANAPGLPPLVSTTFGGPLTREARFQSAQFVRVYARCGNSMARVLDTGRLFKSLLPELEVRWKAAVSAHEGVLEVQTDVGNVRLVLSPQGLRLLDADEAGDANLPRIEARIPQQTLARLALGAFRPSELWEELPLLSATARGVLEILFPERQPHMNLPDRF